MGIRAAAAVALGRAARWGGETFMHRSAGNIPGAMALKVDPMVLVDLAKKVNPVAVISGTNGKTTTTNLVADCLQTAGVPLYCNREGNNLQSGIVTSLMLAPDTSKVVDAASAAQAPVGCFECDEMYTKHVLPRLRPHYFMLLNLFRDQLDRFGEIDRIQATIAEALAKTPETTFVFNGDDPLLNTVTLPQTILRCGRGEGCSVRVTDVDDRGIEGIACTVTTAKASYRLATASPGGFMIYPMAMAAAIGEALGLTGEEITAGVAAYVPTGSRMHIIHLSEERLLIDDCYNANPQAMTEALKLLAVTQTRRRAAVLGDMGELGELTVSAHRAIGALTGELHLDSVIAIGEKARDIASAAPNAQWFPSVEDALPAVRAAFTGGTAMLVKASHAMHFENIVKELEQS